MLPSLPDVDDTGAVVAWVAEHLGHLSLEGPDSVRPGGHRGGQAAADAALAALDVTGYARSLLSRGEAPYRPTGTSGHAARQTRTSRASSVELPVRRHLPRHGSEARRLRTAVAAIPTKPTVVETNERPAAAR